MRNCLGSLSFILLLSLLALGLLLLLSFWNMTGQAVFINGTPVSLSLATRTALPVNPVIEPSAPLEQMPLPSQTPVPPPTATPDPVYYRTEVLLRLRHFADALTSFQDSSEKLGENPDLLNDSGWRQEVQGNLDAFVTAAQSLGSVEPAPPEYQAIQEWLKRVRPEAENLRANYQRGIESGDRNAFAAAGENMERIIEYLTQAQIELIAAGWE